MIPKKAKAGGRTAGLLYYLYGPGRANEHVDPHMVAAWDGGVLDPGREQGTTIPILASLLDAPLYGLETKIPDQHVYHVPVSNDSSDRILSDEEWADIAREIMDASGIAPKGDPMGARWIAVRHDPQHIHIVATLARQDGRAPNLRRDMVKMQARARELEGRYGLRQLTSGDKTASRWPTTAEAEKANRNGRDEPPRTTLQGKVRQAASTATSEDAFFTAIQRAGIRLNKRTAPDGSVTGYSVALPGDRTGAGRAVWFSGSRLAPDLSLPRVRERWTGTPATTAVAVNAGQVTSQAAAWQAAAWQVHQAAAILGNAGDEAGAGEMVALSDFLTTYAAHAPTEVRQELQDAARTFERAGRAPTARQMHTDASGHLRMATQLVVMSTSLGMNGGEASAAITILVAVALAVIAAQRFHQAAQHRAQEQAAAEAGYHLRAATEVAYGASTGHGRRGGTRAVWRETAARPNAPELTGTYAPAVREAIPKLAERVLGEEAWPALAATLKQAEGAGYMPAQLLAEVSEVRGFGDAESAAEVLVWRLQKRMESGTQAASVTPPATDQIPPGSSGGPGVPPPVVSRTAQLAGMPLGEGTTLSLGEVVRQAVPGYADRVMADPASANLAAHLRQAAEEGYQPVELLADVAGARDLAGAESVAQVLSWRLRGRLSADTGGVIGHGAIPRGAKTHQAPATGERTAAERAAQDALQQRNQARSPRR
ncbi:relaxase/mobilization nuclease domain-containing protein [Streptomyces sp. NBC_01174]|uniref:relaxase/mobilization nuclease domain-containing protein n=1 Tax=Streptomyces sp. NBC_01174 TaxID=2903758 RepID=UPI002F9082FB|nr:mobilization protein [Streptomyces sp. NBC_01174]